METIKNAFASKTHRKLILTIVVTALAPLLVSLSLFWELATTLPVIILAISVLATVVLAASVLYNVVIRPLVELKQAASRAAAGHLTAPVAPGAGGEFDSLAESVNALAGRLHRLTSNLEDRIDERTRALEAIALISRQITMILDVDQLMQEVVSRIQVTFEYYHVHIYLIDHETGELVMREGTGVVGQRLKELGHKLQPGQGIVGGVAESGEPFLASNVDDVPHFFRNPHLPKTKAELAVPLRKGDTILGVLDLQSTRVGDFSQEDMLLLQSVADQVAVAIENARLFRQLQQALQEAQELGRQLVRETWRDIDEKVYAAGFKFTKNGVMPAPNEWGTAMARAVEQRQVIRDGQGQNKADVAVPLKLRDEVIGVIGIERDPDRPWSDDEVMTLQTVSDQIARALENARLSQKQEKTIEQLKEVDRLKSEFLTSMSHELRTPLNSIIGFADVLLQGIDGELNDLAMHDIQLIYNSGQHLLALINDVLDLSKIEAEKMELIIEAVDVSKMVDEVVAASNSLLKNKPVDLVLDIEKELPPIQADKLRLTQVLLNLVSNAAKFTDEGTITIRAGLMDGVPDYARIAVIDTGIGVPEEKQLAIFDRFRQADSSTTRRYGGTGLGLAICRELVELHDGEIGVISQPGDGSEFFFTIPLARRPAVV